MTTTVVYASVDGAVESSSNTYSTARAGSGSFEVQAGLTAWDTVGQAFYSPTYYLMESFYAFDTSGIDDGDTVSAAQFSLYGNSNKTTTDFTVRLAAFDFDTTVTSADWQDGTEMAALTVLATFATSGFSIAAYNDFTDSGGMAASVSKTGTTRYVIFSDRLAAGTTPTGEEWFAAWFSEQTGTTNDPKLTVTHAASGVTGTGAVTVATSAAASGTPVVTGTGAASIAPAASGTGTGVVTGSGAATVAPSVAASGTPVVTATGAAQVAASAAAAGTPVVAGTGAATIAPAAAASGTSVVTGTGAATIAPSVAGQGEELQPIEGTGAVSVAVQAAGTGSGIVTGSGVITIPAAMAAALGTQVVSGTGGVSIAVGVSGSGAPDFDWTHAHGTVTLSALSAASVTVSAPDAATVSISSSGSGVVTT